MNTGQLPLNNRKNISRKIELFSLFEVIIGFLALIIGLFSFFFVFFVMILIMPSDSDIILNIINNRILITGIVLIPYGLLSLWFGTRLSQFKNYGRGGSILIGWFSIFIIPFSIFGIGFPFSVFFVLICMIFGLLIVYYLNKFEYRQLFNEKTLNT